MNQPYPESWATASVFAYAQSLRRLVGIWTREAALAGLNCRKTISPKNKAERDLTTLSKSWSKFDITELLWSMYVNSAQTHKDDLLDPDFQTIPDDSPRSAILFGPPGTGKTSLVKAIADLVGWHFVELHPSHFVAEGLPDVQHTADRIFRQLRELDHAVVLFDEVDELVRERDIEPDQFGRFLTTSMLPRLAQLWKARKVMYFVATNHIEYFDRAVTRSERFDAILYIGPPSFSTKRKELLEILWETHRLRMKFDRRVTQHAIEKALPDCSKIGDESGKERREFAAAQPLPPASVLSKFALLRWDELNELANQLVLSSPKSKTITLESLASALTSVKDQRSRTLGEYYHFVADPGYQRYDASKVATWIIAKIDGFKESKHPLPPGVEKSGEMRVLRVPVGVEPRVKGYTVRKLSKGRASLKKNRSN